MSHLPSCFSNHIFNILAFFWGFSIQRLVRMLGPLDRKVPKSKVKVKSIGRSDVSIQLQAVLSKDMSLGPQVLAKGKGLLKMIGML
jgi:hypothetical protein